ncbi:MAG: small acid-soluble spore protein SspI [Planifilum sp.]|jgi:small acid-soluble spore protein I (minor)|uniref:Small, acid-soluble spore protein I n=1 Tax=Novibacillus thermophilus TaxID=1471761 RepID=A0A1U9K4F6_9BACL|nr:small acid-soluble spore protein SspI [Novibacillus thermophilus]AQS54908.1 small acid-soluble spore protein SspI [Novibacillus thermophilus]
MGLDNISIRKAVIHNIHDMTQEELRDMVTDSIEQKEEKLLPGLGVVFELIWENISSDLRRQLIDTLHAHLPDHAEKPI